MSKYYYLDKNIKNTIPESTYKRTQKAQDSDDYASGDIIEAWDHVFRWDASCISDCKMQTWRARGDTLADAALPFIMSSAAGGTDLFARLEAAASRSDAAKEVKALWKQLNAGGGGGRDGFDFDRAQVARGQAVFYRYAPQVLASLLQFSLAAGFSSSRISRLLNLTSYLVPPMSSTPEGEAPRITKASNDRTYMRLMETTQFVVDCMSADAMELDNDGWKAAIRVRLLHATMRRRLLEKVRGEMSRLPDPPYSEDRDGVPLSQEDMAGTLASFSGAPMLNVMKVGITPSLQECEDYVALWKVIGYYIGIDRDILEAHMSSWHQCTRLTASAIVNIFAGESDPPPAVHFPMDKALVPKSAQIVHARQRTTSGSVWTTPATLPVLFSVVGRWPSPFDFQDQAAASRRLMGDTLADWLSVPRTSLTKWVLLHIGFMIVNIPATFGQFYRVGWDRRRRATMQESVQVAVYSALGDRDTKFRPRAPNSFEAQVYEDEFGSLPWLKAIAVPLEWMMLYAEMVLVLFLASPLIPLCCIWALSASLFGWNLPLVANSFVLVPSR